MEAGRAAAEAPPPAEGASDRENEAPGEEGSLRKMFVQGAQAIATHRTDNLFQNLEERTLTEEEQRIIEQRVALQRRMFEEYERRERQRKLAELREVCPDVSQAEAEAALDLCDGREDDAAAQLVSDPAFRRRVIAASNGTLASEPAAPPVQAPARREAAGRQLPSWQANPGPRPKVIDPAKLNGKVFVGAFRGKGFKPPPKGRQQARKACAAAAADSGPAASSGSGLEEEEEAEEESVDQGQEEQEEDELADAEQQQGGVQEQQEQAGQGEQPAVEEQQGGQQAAAAAPAAPPPAVGGVMLWPAAAAPPALEPQRYVLVRADTLEAPTDSQLRTARRQLGEPSDSRLPGNGEQPTPASEARSRPAADGAGKQLATVAEEEPSAAEDAAAAAAAAAAEPAASTGTSPAAAAQAAAADEQQAAPSAAQGRPGRRGAAPRQAGKRAASAALSDSEATETEDEEPASSSDEEMEDPGSSDSDFVRPAPRRTQARAAAQPPPRRARPARAAKNAAAATLLAYAVDSEEEEEGGRGYQRAAAASSSDEEGGVSLRQARRLGGGRAASRSAPPPSSRKKAPARKKQRVEEAEEAEEGGSGSGASAQQQRHSSEPEQQAGAEEGGAAAAAGAADSSRPPQVARVRAISSTGHTCRGRVKQKSHKSAELVQAGTLRAEKGWYNAGYIFPEGFQSRTLFRSSVDIGQLCVHECSIIGQGGQYWPHPTFKVVALDRPDEPLIAKSCTGCWTGVLKRINAEIEARRRAGEDLPPPPKTAIAGPEYFGLNQGNIQEAVEDLDPEGLCTEYWAGKQERMAAAAGLPMPAGAGAALRAARAPRAAATNGGARRAGGGGGRGRKRRGGGSDSEDEQGGDEEEDETQLITSKWSAVSRADRYRKRLQENGEDTSVLDRDNPLPHFIDPITMSAVVRPAISPWGYVAGLATWKVVLAEKPQCPFTNQPLKLDQIKLLTKSNIHLHRDKIVNGTPATLRGPDGEDGAGGDDE